VRKSDGFMFSLLYTRGCYNTSSERVQSLPVNVFLNKLMNVFYYIKYEIPSICYLKVGLTLML